MPDTDSKDPQNQSTPRLVVTPDQIQKYLALGNILADSAGKSCRSQAQTKDLHEKMYDRRREEEDIHKRLCEMIVDCNF